ncbi:MAG: serine/threonine-protein kinase, partial [Planctomycetaceae bacterium]
MQRNPLGPQGLGVRIRIESLREAFMTAPVVTDRFLKLLSNSDLLSSEMMDKAVSQLKIGQCESAEEAAKVLVKQRLITPFQAERLLAGRARGFFVDEYKIREIVGVGGMGCIYVAENTQTKARVALKVLTSNNELDAGMLTRLKLEAQAGIKLSHPNVLKTHEIADTGAVLYVAMEFVKGVSLHEVIALGGPIGWSQACDLFHQAANGLSHAHSMGMVHRDIKPANFIVDHEGNLKVLDFGLALLSEELDEEFSLAMIFGHECLGTADFIAPEQSLNSGDVDCRADIYSLGCTMYLTLTGHFPFPYDTTSKKLDGHRTKQARPVRDVNPDIPQEVADIIKKMMHKRPEHRFQNCNEVAQALSPFAKRRTLNFDFQRILSMRIKDAKNRDRALRIGQNTGISSATGSRTGSGSRRRLQTELDTVVGKDTEPVGPQEACGVSDVDDDKFTGSRSGEIRINTSAPGPVPCEFSLLSAHDDQR